ncbi:hypothetical protein [Paenibacillus sp. S-12]|uniref:hypothetical protein n=1 Tax=Paenibacillus sp. S-12 TaxID=3031371 RepID=UPI0025A30B6E|nr:hypothetical protein [Paenibacillus sp. S-12]
MKMTSKLAIAAICGMLMFSCMNNAAEAAPAKSEIDYTVRDPSGEPKVLEDELARLNKLIEKNPGESYGIFIDNEKTKSQGSDVIFTGHVAPSYETYEDYLKKAADLKGVILVEPTNLPEGYSFAKAELLCPFSPQFKNDLRAEAKQKGAAVLSKKYEWTEAGQLVLEYKNGEDKLLLEYIARDSKASSAQKGYHYQTADEKRQKLKPEFRNSPQQNTLLWTEQGRQFRIITNEGNTLTKADLIKLAETMVRINR